MAYLLKIKFMVYESKELRVLSSFRYSRISPVSVNSRGRTPKEVNSQNGKNYGWIALQLHTETSLGRRYN